MVRPWSVLVLQENSPSEDGYINFGGSECVKLFLPLKDCYSDSVENNGSKFCTSDGI